jgi:hypothetical protein
MSLDVTLRDNYTNTTPLTGVTRMPESLFVAGLVELKRSSDERRTNARIKMLRRRLERSREVLVVGDAEHSAYTLANDIATIEDADLDALAQSLCDEPVSREESLQRFVEHLEECWRFEDADRDGCHSCGSVMHDSIDCPFGDDS